MKKIILCLFVTIAALVANTVVSSAQLKEIKRDLSVFSAIEIDNDFNVNVVISDENNYSEVLTVDAILVDYVKTYVKNNTLYIDIDKKAFPAEVKKLYKGKKSLTPSLQATVYMPNNLKSLTLGSASIVSVNDEIVSTSFDLNLKNNSKVLKLTVDTEEFNLKAQNKSETNLTVYADVLNVDISGSSVLKMNSDTETLNLTSSNSANVSIDGQSVTVKVNASGSSENVLKGKTEELVVKASNSSFVDAINMSAYFCTLNLSNSSKLYETATDKLVIEMSGSSTLVFDENPEIEIIGVKNSTITRYENLKK